MQLPVSALSVTLPLLLLIGCEAPLDDRAFTQRDSADVTIVESMAGIWGEREGWKVGDGPTLQIGVVEGDPAYQFSTIVSVLRLDDGRLVVGERTTGQLRFFGADGTFLSSVGGRGEGPGEFGNMSGALPYRGDSILVWDSRLSRVTVFDRNGHLGRVQSVLSPDPPGGLKTQGTGTWVVMPFPGSFQGVFADGSLIHTATTSVALDVGEFVRPEVVFMRLTPDGATDGELGAFLGPSLGDPPPFADRFERVVGGDRLYVGTGSGGRFEIQMRASEGSGNRLIRAYHRDATVTQAHRNGYLAQLRESADDPGSRAELERSIAEIEFPATVPAFTDLIVDSQGHLWVGNYPVAGAVGPRFWSVFDIEGRLLGDVQTPTGFTVHQIGRDFIAGVWRDELVVPYVQVYALDRETGGE